MTSRTVREGIHKQNGAPVGGGKLKNLTSGSMQNNIFLGPGCKKGEFEQILKIQD
jgi:hypothetical protein